MIAASSLFSPKPGYPAIRLLSPQSIMFSASWTGILLLRGGSITIVVSASNRLANDLFMVEVLVGNRWGLVIVWVLMILRTQVWRGRAELCVYLCTCLAVGRVFVI